MCVAEGRGGGGEQGVQQGDGGVVLRGQLLLRDRGSPTHQVLVPGPLQAHQGGYHMLHSVKPEHVTGVNMRQVSYIMLSEFICDSS